MDNIEIIASLAQRVTENVEKVIVGKRREVEMTLIALLCEGHLLIEDVPGVGKTMLARAIAKSIGCTFKRLQFTPDMLPSDVTGVSVFNQKTLEFEFRPGPVMAQIVLADEINRATPKTQSALLEAMEERQVTVDGLTYPMERPFLVLATQNPIEYEGTFPLPEAQIDRFMMRLSLGYPSAADEMHVLDMQRERHPIEEIGQVVSDDELLAAQNAVKSIYADDLIKEYIVELANATRRHPDIYLGVSPRGSLALFRTSRALAALRGRTYVIPDDIKALLEATFAHRLIISPSARIKNVEARAVVEQISQSIPVPGTYPGTLTVTRSIGIFLLWVVALVFATTSGRDIAFNLLYFISGVIVAALIWAWANQRGLALRRDRAQRSQVGKYFEETLELVNRSRFPKLWVEVHDYSNLPGHHVSRVVNSLGRNATSRWQVRTLSRRRGRYNLGPITITSGDPLGIFRFTRSLPEVTSLVVTPQTVDVSQFMPPSGYLPGGETLHRRTPYVTASVSGVRDYVPGDSFNRIHWPSSARTGRLISKEFELDPLSDVWLFLDMYGDAHAETPWESPVEDIELPWLSRAAEQIELPPSTVEYSVTIAASLVQHFLEADREVGFLSYAPREVVQPDRGERQLIRLQEILAVIQAEGRVPLTQVLASEGTTLARHITLIVITPSTDSRWVAALRSLRARVYAIAVLLAARTFGPAPEWEPVLGELQANGVPAYLVQKGDDLTTVLGRLASGNGRGTLLR